MNYFKKNLKYLSSLGICNQNQLSIKLNCTRQTINSYINGKGEPSYEKLIIISKTYNVSIDDLLLKDLELEDKNK